MPVTLCHMKKNPLFTPPSSAVNTKLWITQWQPCKDKQSGGPATKRISRTASKLMSTELVIPSNHLILCHSFLLLPSIFPIIRVFFSESVLRIRWPKYWGFSFSISPSNEYSGLISFRIDWLELLVVQETLKSLLQTPQFKSINSSVLSFLYSPTLTFIHDHGKNHSLD